MRRLLAAAAATVAVAAPAALPATPAAVAKTCSSAFTHAVINGSQKCLHAGEYCARGANRQYRRYGFYCASSGRLRES